MGKLYELLWQVSEKKRLTTDERSTNGEIRLWFTTTEHGN